MIDRPHLEKLIVLDHNPAPVVVVDFHVYLHDVLRWYEDKIEGSFSTEVEEKLIKGAWALKVNRGPDMLPRHSYRIVVVADSRFKDTGNYWRDKYMTESTVVTQAWEQYAEKEGKKLTEIPTHYKGHRKDKTDNFWRVFDIGWKYVNEYFPTFSQEGFEADDIAGAIYRISRDGGPDSVARKRQIFLSTIDRDWSQLVDESHKVYFANTRVPFPKEKIQERLVGEQGVVEHTKHKMGFDLDHPKNLADWKVLHGDLGDNLPPGSPKCLFDLCEPHTEYVIEKAAPWHGELVGCLEDPKANDLPDHFETTLRQFAKIMLEAPVKL
jgi:hypothetical protein